MTLIVLIMNKVSYLEDILQEFNSIGIKGATVIDGMGVGRAMSDHMNKSFIVTYSLRKVIDGGRPYNKIILSVIEDSIVDLAYEAVEKIIGDLHESGKGIMFSVSLDRVAGLPKIYY